MQPFTTLSGQAIPFGAANIDTDVIIPARFLKTISRAGLGKGAFAALRENPDNVFDAHAGAHECCEGRVPAELLAVAQEGQPITVDLENQVVTTPFQDRFEFTMDPFRKQCLISGQDEIGLTLGMGNVITAHEARLAAERPWIAGAAHRGS